MPQVIRKEASLNMLESNNQALHVKPKKGHGKMSDQKKLHTIEEIFALPDGERAELIDGVIYNLATPRTIHQRISMDLSYMIYNHIKEKGLDCEVYAAPFAVFPNKDEYNYLEPDICVVCDKSKLDERGCNGAPDFVIEIVNPSSQKMDYLLKMNKYQSCGVRLYWIVDPLDETVTVYDFENEDFAKYRFSDSVPVTICQDFSIRLGSSDKTVS